MNKCFLTTCNPTVRNVAGGNSGDKKAKEYFEYSEKG